MILKAGVASHKDHFAREGLYSFRIDYQYYQYYIQLS